jgi:hypothetical protein
MLDSRPSPITIPLPRTTDILNRIITFCDNKLKGQKHIQYLEFSKISVVSKLHHMQGTLKD